MFRWNFVEVLEVKIKPDWLFKNFIQLDLWLCHCDVILIFLHISLLTFRTWTWTSWTCFNARIEMWLILIVFKAADDAIELRPQFMPRLWLNCQRPCYWLIRTSSFFQSSDFSISSFHFQVHHIVLGSFQKQNHRSKNIFIHIIKEGLSVCVSVCLYVSL